MGKLKEILMDFLLIARILSSQFFLTPKSLLPRNLYQYPADGLRKRYMILNDDLLENKYKRNKKNNR